MPSVLRWLTRPALLRALLTQVRLAARLVREPGVPATVKALLAVPALYVASPVDALPDLVPLLGQLDDIGVLLLAMQAFVSLCPAAAVAFHRAALAAGRRYAPMTPTDRVIEAEWRRQ